MSPEEIGLLLVALGFDNSTYLYLASHKGVWWGEYESENRRFPGE